MDKNRLFLQAIGKFLLGVIVIGLLLFLPAVSLQYWQGWLLMGILFVPMFCAGLVMMVKNPELLRKRLNAKEEEKEQQEVVKRSGLLFVASFVVAGLKGHRHGALWGRPTSDVYGHNRLVPSDAAGAGFAHLFPYNVAVHSADRHANQE